MPKSCVLWHKKPFKQYCQKHPKKHIKSLLMTGEYRQKGYTSNFLMPPSLALALVQVPRKKLLLKISLRPHSFDIIAEVGQEWTCNFILKTATPIGSIDPEISSSHRVSHYPNLCFKLTFLFLDQDFFLHFGKEMPFSFLQNLM